MLEEIKGNLMERWATNIAKIEDYSEFVLPRIKKVLERRQDIPRFFIAGLSGDMIYEVRHTSLTRDNFTVDLKRLECSYRIWMLIGFPCYHEITYIQSRSQDPAEYIPLCYRKKTYQACCQPFIYATNGENLWELTQHSDIVPPPSKRASGRPKRRRKKDVDEKIKDSTNVSRKGLPNKFSVCGISGHNKSSCPAKPSQAKTVTNVQPQPTIMDQSQTSICVKSQTTQSQTTLQVQIIQTQPTQIVQTRQSQTTTPFTIAQSQPTQRVQTRMSASSSRIQTRHSISVSQLLVMRRGRQVGTTTFQQPTTMRLKLEIRRKTR
ncbi:unnamed protein product [Lathyrus sativus]|nr:unnamed protein product [Lathyrus sativus]